MKASSITVSVVLPMRNEEARVRRCLDSILAGDFPQSQLEVLVVDGSSTDKSRAIAIEYASQFDVVRVLDNPLGIVSCGLNLGIRKSSGNIVIVMGVHCEYPHDYISTCVRRLNSTHAEVVGGVLETRAGSDTLTARAIALMMQHLFGVGRSAFRTRDATIPVDTVPYGAYKREIFERVGLFNEDLVRNQDFELNARIRKAGGTLLLCHDLQVAYYSAPTFRQLGAQAYGNGLWLAAMWFVSPTSFRLRHAAPLTLVSAFLIAALCIPLVGSAIWLLATLALAYLSALLLASAQVGSNAGCSLFFPVFASFMTQHICYGVGTIFGLLYPLRSRYSRTLTRADAADAASAHGR